MDFTPGPISISPLFVDLFTLFPFTGFLKARGEVIWGVVYLLQAYITMYQNLSYNDLDLPALLDLLSDATSKYTRALSSKEPADQLEAQQSEIDNLIKVIEEKKRRKVSL